MASSFSLARILVMKRPAALKTLSASTDVKRKRQYSKKKKESSIYKVIFKKKLITAARRQLHDRVNEGKTIEKTNCFSTGTCLDGILSYPSFKPEVGNVV